MNILIIGYFNKLTISLSKKMINKSKKTKIFLVDLKNKRNEKVEIFSKKFRRFNYIDYKVLGKKGLDNLVSSKKINFVYYLVTFNDIKDDFFKKKNYFDKNIITFFNILKICKTFKILLIYLTLLELDKKIKSNKNSKINFNQLFFKYTKLINEQIAQYFYNNYRVISIGIRLPILKIDDLVNKLRFDDFLTKLTKKTNQKYKIIRFKN